jgi:C-terminal processing protease CtpA/Prc
MREWYLFPETLPANLNPDAYPTVEGYLDALTATARAQGRDRFFSYLTSIKADEAFFNSGTMTGFGMRVVYDGGQKRVFVADAYQNAPAWNAELRRTHEILAIGTSSGDMRLVSDLMASGGPQAVADAFGPETAGTTRVFRLAGGPGGSRDITLTKAQFTLVPISFNGTVDYGAQKVGWINIRAFIGPTEQQLRSQFANSKPFPVTDYIVDLRYAGNRFSPVSELLGDFLGAKRSSTDVMNFTTFRPEKSSNNKTRFFQPQPDSIGPERVAFIGSAGTGSGSEMLINSFVPYYHKAVGLVGSNTRGHPVGEISLDRAECDDRLRVVAFKIENAARQGDYYDGLASKMEASCAAADDLNRGFNDIEEQSFAAALEFVRERSCAPIGAAGTGNPRQLLMPERPTPVQHDMPGTF